MWISLSFTIVLLAVYQQQDFVCASQISSKAVNLTIAHPNLNKEVIHNNVLVGPLRRHLAVVLAVVQHATQQTREDVDGSHLKDAVTAHKLKEIVETSVKLMKERLRRQTSTKYQPYTSEPYDLGPLDQCVKPSVGKCTFSSDITVPEYYARQIRSLDNAYATIDDQLKNIPGVSSECANNLVALLCDVVVTVTCVGNGMVSLQPRSATACQSSLTKLSGCSITDQSLLQTLFCTDTFLDLSQYDISGQYSLADCRTPAISTCDVSAQSPEWIAVQYEHAFNRQKDNHIAVASQLTGDCQTNYLRKACTMPTCTSENRLQGTLSSSQCQVVSKCIADASAVNVSPASLHCEEYKTIATPSADLGIGSNLPILLFATAFSMLHLVY